MTVPVALLLWLFVAGAVALVALGWASLAAFSDTARWTGALLLAATAGLAAWPSALTRWNDGAVAPYGLPLLAGTALILGAALASLISMRRRGLARLAAGVASAASLHYLAVLAAVVFWPA